MFDTSKERKAMEEVVQRFNDEMKKVRTGRAHPDMLASVKVEAYGQFMDIIKSNVHEQDRKQQRGMDIER